MRIIAAAAAATLLASAAHAAEVPANLSPVDLDLTGAPIARNIADRMQLGAVERAQRSNFAAAPIPGWTVTQVGNYVILQDDGTHGCSTLDMNSGTGFDTCIGGGTNAGGGSTGAIDAFYAAFPGANPGYIATYLGWDTGAFGAFYAPIASDTKGIGQKHFTGSDTFGDPTGLNGWIFMNSIQMYNGFGASNQQLLFDLIWGQEFEHRWAAFVHFDDHGTDSKALIGRQDAHWSWFMDTNWSWMEGNSWKESGNSFTTDFDVFSLSKSHKCDMDLYLMGLIPASAVKDFMLITNPTGGHQAGDTPQFMAGGPATITGVKKMISVKDVIKAEGERSPDFTAQPRNSQVATLVILRPADDPNDVTLRATMQQFTDGETSLFALETHDLGHVTTDIGAMPANLAPVAAFTAPATAKQNGAEVTLDASGSTDSDGIVKGYVWDFGDGSGDFLTGKVVSHKFLKSGPTTVTLTVVDDLGGAATTTQSLDVAAAPKDDGLLGCGCDLAAGAHVNPFAAMLLTAFGLVGLGARRRNA